MDDYKSTLNLPQTDFPMRANLPNREPEMLAQWQQDQLYTQLQTQIQDRDKTYVLHDGPPYANGDLHIGHAVNKTLKDMVCKAKLLAGYKVAYLPGWDCHGLPIEHKVEQKTGKPGAKISPAEFRQACRDYAHKFVDIQRQGFERLGVLGLWDQPYLTLNPGYEADIIRALAKIIDNGHLHRGAKPVHWCLDCQSALAEAEVEYQDKTSHAIDVLFAVLPDDLEKLASACSATLPAAANQVGVPIWTTTDWTLPANQAVALHPELNYQLVQCQIDGQMSVLLLAEDLRASTLERYQASEIEVLGSCQGAALERLQLQHPLYQRVVPVVLGEHVTTESGTGAVHTAPAHGVEDYAVGQAYGLPLESPVNGRGVYRDEVELFAGQHIKKAEIIEQLQANGTLLAQMALEHSYPHCWRHKTPLIFRATPQWFISMDNNGLRQQALAAIEQVNWVPAWGQARITNMIAGRPDWCISRQRTWGTPMALIIHRETEDLHPRMVELMEVIAQRVEQDGLEAWHALELSELLGDEAADYQKVPDTLDVWFDSGVSHFAVLQQRENLAWPADMYLEGSDQHRGWFHSSLLTSVAMYGEAPYRSVLTHGFAVDAKGHKMSKSLGNVVAPDQVIKSLGADVLRWWVAATDYTAEMTVSDEILQRSVDGYRRVRNTIRFLLSNLADFDVEHDAVPFDQMLALDQWVLLAAEQQQQSICQHYQQFAFYKVCQQLQTFCSGQLGGFYLDVIKDRQYTMPANSRGRRSAQTAMYHVLRALLLWLAPVCSFTAEEAWRQVPGASFSIFTEQWYALPVGKERFTPTFWATLQQVRDAVNRELEQARKEDRLGGSLEAAVTLYCQPELLTGLQALGCELRFALITSEASVEDAEQRDDQAVETELSGLWVKVAASTDAKCQRCWHRREDVDSSAEYPGVCQRCVTNLASAEGEEREFV